MKLHSWGRFPIAESQSHRPRSQEALQASLGALQGSNVIARGMGRSYGDSALAANVILTQDVDLYYSFDETTGHLRCASGVTIDSILQTFLPKGWFLPVVPGTRFVSIGGAIASDIHGKNHHIDGSFCDHIISLSLLLPTGEIQTCSATHNSKLFHATCAGMGLTGIVLEATIVLSRIHSSAIRQSTLRARNLEEVFEQFEAHHDTTYSVAWLDCLAQNEKLGRSLLFLGEHESDEQFKVQGRGAISVPFTSPSQLLNRYSMSAFNSVYFNKPVNTHKAQRIEAYKYFFPLDSILHWNRLYGRKGFVQYQCVIPDAAALLGIRNVLRTVSTAGKGSFLSVLKRLGPENRNMLSFPMQGYTLAMDFKVERNIFALLDELDNVVADHGGRVYLAKDARMSEAMFKRFYPRWEELQQLRAEIGADSLFNSLQSKRLGI